MDAEQIYNKEDSLSGKAMFPWASVYDETNLGGIHQFFAAGIMATAQQESGLVLKDESVGTTIPQGLLQQLWDAMRVIAYQS
jgi:hypothetical protein